MGHGRDNFIQIFLNNFLIDINQDAMCICQPYHKRNKCVRLSNKFRSVSTTRAVMSTLHQY